MNEVEIINEVDWNVQELDELSKYIEFVLKYEKLEHVLFNVIIVDNAYIHKLDQLISNRFFINNLTFEVCFSDSR